MYISPLDSLQHIVDSLQHLSNVGTLVPDTIAIEMVSTSKSLFDELIPYIPILVALITAIVAIYQLRKSSKNNLKQQRENAIINTRLNWIKEVRENVTNFLTAVSNIERGYEINHHVDEAFKKRDQYINDNYANLAQYYLIIFLYLNDTKKYEASRDALIKVKVAIGRTASKEHADKLSEYKLEFITQIEKLLREEWESVNTI